MSHQWRQATLTMNIPKLWYYHHHVPQMFFFPLERSGLPCQPASRMQPSLLCRTHHCSSEGKGTMELDFFHLHSVSDYKLVEFKLVLYFFKPSVASSSEAFKNLIFCSDWHTSFCDSYIWNIWSTFWVNNWAAAIFVFFFLDLLELST